MTTATRLILLSIVFMAVASVMFFGLVFLPEHTANAPPPGIIENLIENLMIWGFVAFGWATWLIFVIGKGPPPWTLFWCGIAVSAVSWASLVLGVCRLALHIKRRMPNKDAARYSGPAAPRT